MPGRVVVQAPAGGHSRRYWWLGIIATILLAALAIAAMTNWLRHGSEGEDVAVAPIAATRTDGEARATLRCEECGIVASTRKIEQVGTAGRMTGTAPIDVPRQSTTSYEITIRMRDGSRRVFMDANPGNWRPGDRMTLIESTGDGKD